MTSVSVCLRTYMCTLTGVKVVLSLGFVLEFSCGQEFLTLYFLRLGFVLLFLLLAGLLRNPAETVHFASSWPLLSLLASLFSFFLLFSEGFCFSFIFSLALISFCRFLPKTRTKKNPILMTLFDNNSKQTNKKHISKHKYTLFAVKGKNYQHVAILQKTVKIVFSY